MSKDIVKGYKVFNPDWTCSPNKNIVKQYTCPGKFEEDVEPEVCKMGMHFCENLINCFRHYNFNPENHVAEVVAYGDVIKDENKYCTNKLEIVRELTWEEVLRLVNIGKNCSGIKNCGDFNTGNCNCGDYNSGCRNCGDSNIGDYNCGISNDGNYNRGHRNSGNYNSGDYNSGDRNRGNHNSGDYNSGDWNTCYSTTGCFNTTSQYMYFFNKSSNYTIEMWEKSIAAAIMWGCPMEKTKAQEWYDDLDDGKKNAIKNIPNFDAEIFKEITGINVNRG